MRKGGRRDELKWKGIENGEEEDGEGTNDMGEEGEDERDVCACVWWSGERWGGGGKWTKKIAPFLRCVLLQPGV